jgi:hypothetical protein
MAARSRADPLHQRVDGGGTQDGSVAHEGFMAVLDAVVVVEIVGHDAEGFLDRTELGVAEPVDPLEPRAVAEVKTRRNGSDMTEHLRLLLSSEAKMGAIIDYKIDIP